MPYNMKDAKKARDELTVRQERSIRKVYNEWAREARDEAKRLTRTVGKIDEARAATELYYQLRTASKQITSEINKEVEKNISSMGSVVANVNKQWLHQLGFTEESINRKFNPSKDMAIRSILTGNLYDNKMPLSDRIWNSTESNLKDINTIVSKGILTNQSVNEIALQLEKYLNPSKNLGWKTQIIEKDGVKRLYHIRNRKADWRAQRLARTMLQHSYQQTLVAMTKDNPFVTGYIWHAAGNHACELCLDRDGQFYTAEDLPLDHPNGQCDFEVAIDEQKAMRNLSEFYENPIYYPDIQRFTEGLDYED